MKIILGDPNQTPTVVNLSGITLIEAEIKMFLRGFTFLPNLASFKKNRFLMT